MPAVLAVGQLALLVINLVRGNSRRVEVDAPASASHFAQLKDRIKSWLPGGDATENACLRSCMQQQE